MTTLSEAAKQELEDSVFDGVASLKKDPASSSLCQDLFDNSNPNQVMPEGADKTAEDAKTKAEGTKKDADKAFVDAKAITPADKIKVDAAEKAAKALSDKNAIAIAIANACNGQPPSPCKELAAASAAAAIANGLSPEEVNLATAAALKSFQDSKNSQETQTIQISGLLCYDVEPRFCIIYSSNSN